MGVPFVQPLCPGNKKDGLSGAGYAIDNTVAFTDLPGIVLLPAVKDNEIENLLCFRFGQGFSRQVAENNFRVKNRPEDIDLLWSKRFDLPVGIKKPE